ncbi:glycoside hydrolase family 25 protein [Budviciaceae bacterium CWB-B4]|uniref:Glycoside hydrolase family 25 protein n=1 Tax=Limnobaculum xujianqingii TaxID=2738837 RepID=A0A9D7AIF6_9GAMM|nr:glycoside hydrolase family 25 protein [Limnobaculum xujianqingii]MBK5073636.1 glycoside hydrolase family 25 protein [Limnobaculum xujianqingii]MBK5176633.1 glycoside hydrolase family 25 protein [Limnobaculum xujianqingii]
MYKLINKVLTIFLGIIIVGLLLIYGLYSGYIRFNYPSLTEYPVQGIDVSHHQNEINWQQLDKERVRFIFIKATEGGDFKDKSFTINWQKARDQGFVVGAYHFFTFCKPGEKQAQNFIETVPKVVNMLPPVIDLEYGGNCQLTMDKSQVLAEITILIERLEAFYQKKPVLYVTQEFFDDFLEGQFEQNPLWIRNIYRTPALKGQRPWLFWQFANRGLLDGIDTVVDLNAFNGSKEEFETLIKN